MATCPDCQRRDRLTLTQTGRLTNLRPANLAGVQLKYEGQPEHELACDRGWHILGYLDNGHLLT